MFMDIKDFAELIKRKRDRLDSMMRRKMPVMVGRMAKDHFQDNFRQGGFVNGGLHPWPKSKRLSSGGTDAASNYGTLLSGRKHLFKSVGYTPADYRVRVFNEVVYAPVHNWGGEIDVTVTDRMRRFAWAKFYKASGKRKETGTGQKKRVKRRTKPKGLNQQAQFWRNMALTKKKKLHIRIPQRQFMGESEELNSRIREKVDQEITNILNS